MSDNDGSRLCAGVGCGAEFVVDHPRKIYCSYDCYYAATSVRSNERQKMLREKDRPAEGKMCKDCHGYFETKKARMVYCSYECYRHSCLEKNRAYMQKLRDQYKIDSPKEFKKECELCGNKFDYRTKQGKYCKDCGFLARKIARGNGPLNPAYQQNKSVQGQVNNVEYKCFVCGGECGEVNMPCKKCEPR